MRSLAAILTLLFLLTGCSGMANKKDETAGWTAEKLYSEAHDAMTGGAYDKAIKMFEKLEARYPYGRYSQQAQLEIAYAYYKQQEAASAIAACDRFIRLHPNHPNVDYAYYLKGLVNFNDDLGYFAYITQQDMTERDPKAAKDAFLAFKDLVTRFPESRYATDSSQRMAYLLNAMASYEIHAARYYFNRGAYLAAANRAQEALRIMPEAAANEEGLYIMMVSYQSLGIKDLRDDAERVLRKNYPKSKYFDIGLARDSGPWWKLW
jgi:outer membrane protein assembly factor BamD